MNDTLSLDPLPPHARRELIDFYQFLLTKYVARPQAPATASPQQPDIAQLALSLFGPQHGIELTLPPREGAGEERTAPTACNSPITPPREEPNHAAVEAEISPDGHVTLLEPIHLTATVRAVVTLLVPADQAPETLAPSAPQPPRQLGIARGKFVVPDDIDRSNPAIAAMFYGDSAK
jgi:hypothetical protein